MQPMAVGFPEIREAAARGNQHGRTAMGSERMDHQRNGEAEGRRPVAMGCRDHFMERATCQPGIRKVLIDLRQTERQRHWRCVRERAFQSGDDPSKSGDMVRSLHESPRAKKVVQRR